MSRKWKFGVGVLSCARRYFIGSNYYEIPQAPNGIFSNPITSVAISKRKVQQKIPLYWMTCNHLSWSSRFYCFLASNCCHSNGLMEASSLAQMLRTSEAQIENQLIEVCDRAENQTNCMELKNSRDRRDQNDRRTCYLQ